jgi:hypothetical protein
MIFLTDLAWPVDITAASIINYLEVFATLDLYFHNNDVFSFPEGQAIASSSLHNLRILLFIL